MNALPIREVDWQRTVVDLLGVCGYGSMHVRRSIGNGNRWTTTTSVTGWPDLFAWRPARLIAIECKTARGRVTLEQQRVLEELTAAGVDCMVARPADFHRLAHGAPLQLRWRHGEEVAQVVALRNQYDKLFAVAETALTPAELQALTDEHGSLRFSAGTRQTGRQPLQITEVSLTGQPASVGLPEVRWYRHGVSRGNLSSWVRDDLKRGHHDHARRRPTLKVFERESEQEADVSHLRRADERFDPREIRHSSVAGRIIAVNGRPPR